MKSPPRSGSERRRRMGVGIGGFAAFFLVFVAGARTVVVHGEDLRCLSDQVDVGPPNGLLYRSLQKQAFAALAKRDSEYGAIRDVESIGARQGKLRDFLVAQLGGFPDQVALNAAVTGTLPGDRHRVEKVIFNSQPGHRVTANLYLPEGRGPFPAVLVSSGHSRTGKTAAYNQRFGLILARNGIAALCYDPIGQGERSQILDREGKPQFPGTTTEHFLMGVGSILTGTNTARYRIWDGMRAIDYLASRSDVDARRIGFTGCSGGGTLTSYVMALDERVACAAPACYLTTFRRLIETIGPQDAEQNIHGQIAFGLDHPDYVLMRAPRPTLISATTGDFFDIGGTWDNFRQSKRIYARLGFPERIDLVEAEGGHGVQPENLTAIARWMRRWLLDRDDAIADAELPVRKESDLLCTPTGQVLHTPGERSVFELNVERADQWAAERRRVWQSPAGPAGPLAKVRELAGVRPLEAFVPPRREKAGKVQRDGYHIDKLILHTDSGVPLPALTFHPEQPKDAAYLYLHDGGKTADDRAGGPIETLVKQGYVVVAVDLRGWGETSPGKADPLLGDWKNFYLAYLLGRSLVGLRTEDALASAHFLAYYQTEKPREVHLVGVGEAGVVALHAAALEPQLFTSVTVRDGLASWSEVVGQRVPAGRLTSTIHGALSTYDLPDLVRTIGPQKLRLEKSQ